MAKKLSNTENSVLLELINSNDLQKLFFELKDNIQIRMLNTAFRAAGKPIINSAKQNFNSTKKSKSSSNYADFDSSFKMRPLKKNNNIGMLVGMQHREGYIYRFLNFGTTERFTKKGKNRAIHSTGKIEPSLFFNKAVEDNKDKSLNIIGDSIMKSMDRLIKKYEKK